MFSLLRHDEVQMRSRRPQLPNGLRLLASSVLLLALACTDAPEHEPQGDTAEVSRATFVAPDTEAGRVLAAAQAEAAATDRLLFVHSGADW